MSFIFLLLLGGFGAGVVTGLAGASAAAIITPLLTLFAGVPAYNAIAIALFTDVFASSMSAFTFWKNGNIDLKKGKSLTVVIVIGSVFGSYIATLVSSDALGSLSAVMILFVSINFLKKANRMEKEQKGLVEKRDEKLYFQNHKKLGTIIAGLLVGFICGFVGAGGGLMILLILTSIQGLDTKKAVGTSVLIMTFAALSGGIAHTTDLQAFDVATGAFLPNDMSMLVAILITGFTSLIGANLAAKFANKTEEYNLLRIVAVTFLILVLSGALRTVLL